MGGRQGWVGREVRVVGADVRVGGVGYWRAGGGVVELEGGAIGEGCFRDGSGVEGGEDREAGVWVVGGDVAGDFGEVGLGCHFGVGIELVWVGLSWIGEMILWLLCWRLECLAV